MATADPWIIKYEMPGKLVAAQIMMLGVVLAGCEMGLEDWPDEVVRNADEPKQKHCKVVDEWEPNPSAEQPSMMTWQTTGPDFVLTHTVLAYLCSGEEDWYFFETSHLEFASPWLQLFTEIDTPNLCTVICEDPPVKPGPNYAMTVEVYRADDMQLLASGDSSDGEVFLLEPGDYLNDLLIRVYSTTAKAKYPYRLWVLVADGTEPIPSCECSGGH